MADEPVTDGGVQVMLAVVWPTVAPVIVGAPGIVGAAPVPVKGTLRVVPSLKSRRRLAVLPLLVVGAKSTPTSQPASGTSVAQVFVGPSLKCAADVPVIVAEVRLRFPTPLLPMTATSSVEVVPVPTDPNARAAPPAGVSMNGTPTDLPV